MSLLHFLSSSYAHKTWKYRGERIGTLRGDLRDGELRSASPGFWWAGLTGAVQPCLSRLMDFSLRCIASSWTSSLITPLFEDICHGWRSCCLTAKTTTYSSTKIPHTQQEKPQRNKSTSTLRRCWYGWFNIDMVLLLKWLPLLSGCNGPEAFSVWSLKLDVLKLRNWYKILLLKVSNSWINIHIVGGSFTEEFISKRNSQAQLEVLLLLHKCTAEVVCHTE